MDAAIGTAVEPGDVSAGEAAVAHVREPACAAQHAVRDALEILRAIGTHVVPALVRRSSTAYGTIGATFALLVWLLFVGRVIVAAAVYERYRWEHHPPADEALATAPVTD